MRKIHVIGAGLAGLTSAITLRRLGFDVIVIEKEKSAGVFAGIHPSLHITPAEIEVLNTYTSSDLRPLFFPLDEFFFKIEDVTYKAKPPVYLVVKGRNMECAIEDFLYKKARSMGVKFEFKHEVKRLSEIPPGSIIATGFDERMGRILERPILHVYGFLAREKEEKDGKTSAIAIFSRKVSRDYSYFARFRKLKFGMLIQREKKVKEKALSFLKKDLDDFGIHFREWIPLRLPVFPEPRLYSKGFILSGTLAGVMDPLMGFGIHGAIVSGYISARAVIDPIGAVRDFNRMMRYFKPLKFIWELFDVIPWKFTLFKNFLKIPLLPSLSSHISEVAVPGYRKNWAREVYRTMEKVKEEGNGV